MSGTVLNDLKKAFDTVDHTILCHKLKNNGVQNKELSWFESYLSNRKQYCRVGDFDINVNVIGIGVPQGPCLRPVLC